MFAIRRLTMVAMFTFCVLANTTTATRAQDKTKVLTEICYGETKEGKFHQLDLYLPDGQDFPVVVFAHGGAWMWGDKSEYEYLGRFLAKNGIGVAIINYRLAPQTQQPGHVQDMAKAVTWVHANIGKHGGNRDKLFVAGYSAGGHLAALIATDESYLRAEGLNRRSVSGVISISGVYSAEKLPGLDLVFPVKDRDNYFATKHVNATTPKFLLFHAEKEFFGLDTQAKQFHAKLLKAGCKATLQSVSDADHFEMATEKTNRQFGPQVVDFIHGRTNVAAAMK